MVGSSAKEAGRTKTSKPTKRSKQPDSRSRGLCILVADREAKAADKGWHGIHG
nr:hypothetical protein Iba_chr10aCG0930 [Ipomoea batatas]GMD46213.1 hypothetical protein Iba_chr10eCG1160 [Ipomoea batatas]